MQRTHRRQFLATVGRGMIVAEIGHVAAMEFGLSSAWGEEVPAKLTFGDLEPLTALLQETPLDQLLPTVVEKLKSGSALKDLVAAAALANARTFGGEDYIGFHTFMALAPAFRMANELPTQEQALPVLKVLYRNSARMHEHGGPASEVLHPVACDSADPAIRSAKALREAVHRRDVVGAERTFAGLAQDSSQDAFDALLPVVHEAVDVHRTVLAYRAFDMQQFVGTAQAHAMLRQSVRYCVKHEEWAAKNHGDLRGVIPKLLDEHRLVGRGVGERMLDDAAVEKLAQTFLSSEPGQAAGAAAAALAEGVRLADVSEAVAIAANQLLLRDPGRSGRSIQAGKPAGSVHGDSPGVHASDATNAWRNIARVSNSRNAIASILVAAYHVSRDRQVFGNGFSGLAEWPAAEDLAKVTATSPDSLLAALEQAVRGNDQRQASAIARKYGELGFNPRTLCDTLLRFAITEDGSLHAEKYYCTATEEFAALRPAWRWRQLVGLARVTASQFGNSAAGVADAKNLLLG